MQLREAADEDLRVIRETLNRIPKRHRELVQEFTRGINGETKSYHLIAGNWMVNDNAKAIVWQEWYCPTQGEAVMCPGPCPDGTPHTKIENN